MNRFWKTASVLAIAVAILGCQNTATPTSEYLVTGRVLYNNQPFPNALVSTVSSDNSVFPRPTYDSGQSDSQGVFTLEYEEAIPYGSFYLSVRESSTSQIAVLTRVDIPEGATAITHDAELWKYVNISASSGATVTAEASFNIDNPLSEAVTYDWSLTRDSLAVASQTSPSTTFDPPGTLAPGDYRLEVYVDSSTVRIGYGTIFFTIP